ncbi:tyrosine-type recombinase/integrase [Tabrizicola flagellatus]|uniref:tyrosine-type recombinase/integrase n=1 Tax=Tabrizicola flagellatus TaxID=2593021 RepID=UPI0011F1D3FB|nr:tyrosine-type recombinase/integrase [Tabrizicola flagellatus]
MSQLRNALADYLTLRRALGYKMDKADRLLGQFVTFAEDRGEAHVRTETALAWAILPAGAAAIWTSRRLGEVRLFARHLRTLDQTSEVPPTDLLPAQTRRATPYLYGPPEIAALMQATAILRGPHVQATYRTLIGLLAVTGMRIGEAIGLDQGDFDAGSGMVTIRHGKFDKARALPLHPTTVAALQDYLRRDDRPRPAGMTPLLISSRGKRLRYGTVHGVFHKLLQHCGIAPRSAACRPRIHDLRHSFAVSTIEGDYRTGAPSSRLAVLSTYLGHTEPGNTYWYLSGAPELMGLAGYRLERHLAGDA